MRLSGRVPERTGVCQPSHLGRLDREPTPPTHFFTDFINLFLMQGYKDEVQGEIQGLKTRMQKFSYDHEHKELSRASTSGTR